MYHHSINGNATNPNVSKNEIITIADNIIKTKIPELLKTGVEVLSN